MRRMAVSIAGHFADVSQSVVGENGRLARKRPLSLRGLWSTHRTQGRTSTRQTGFRSGPERRPHPRLLERARIDVRVRLWGFARSIECSCCCRTRSAALPPRLRHSASVSATLPDGSHRSVAPPEHRQAVRREQDDLGALDVLQRPFRSSMIAAKRARSSALTHLVGIV